MGSLGEEDLAQMVRDFIESETPTSVSPTNSKPRSLDHQPSLQEILKHTNEEANIQEKVLMYLKDMRSAGHQNQTNNLKKLIVTKLRNDGFEASLCKTSWLCTSTHYKVFRFPGAYEYIDVMVVENGRHKRVIVDIDFRPQFELARPTVRYKEMISNTPLIFVGSEEKLKQIIPLLCSAAKTSLKENGLHVPPWRKHAYMHSKWLSKNCKKVSASPQDIDSGDEGDHHLHHITEEKTSAATCFPLQKFQFCLKP